ncbi:XRE family transcriptional regulator [bacterium]|nr:XRE family transcriptional regulator [bacterium]NBX66837.1 XRE family transcriptional regulator [Pseudomonadota bacterium]
MKELKIIGKNVANYRKKRGLTQEDLCGITEIDRSYLSQIETGRINVTIKTLVAIAEVLKVDLKDLVSD